jgi:hypothetical protein
VLLKDDHVIVTWARPKNKEQRGSPIATTQLLQPKCRAGLGAGRKCRAGGWCPWVKRERSVSLATFVERGKVAGEWVEAITLLPVSIAERDVVERMPER